MADTNKEMIMATGRRKCAIAVVKLVKGKGEFSLTEKLYKLILAICQLLR